MTGFEPFGGEAVNPSWLAVQQLPGEIGGASIDVLEIPTAFKTSVAVIREKLLEGDYDVVLSIGQAGGRAHITPERVGINIDDAGIPDNDGAQPIDEAIYEDGAAAYFTNLPVKRMVEAMTEAGIPARLSNTAGTYVCNHVLYSLGYLSAHEFPGIKFGFIHVPFVEEQVIGKDFPSMSLEDISRALEIAIATIATYDDDVKAKLGETH